MTLPKLFFLYSLSAAALLSEPAIGSRGISSSPVRRDKAPSLPIAPGTTGDCVFWYDNDGSIDCDFMPDFWRMTLEDFLRWNPSITESCGNFQEGYSYCVDGKPPAATTSTDTTTTKAPAQTTTISALPTFTSGALQSVPWTRPYMLILMCALISFVAA
ncbi:Autolysin [Ilyonectria robusta]